MLGLCLLYAGHFQLGNRDHRRHNRHEKKQPVFPTALINLYIFDGALLCLPEFVDLLRVLCGHMLQRSDTGFDLALLLRVRKPSKDLRIIEFNYQRKFPPILIITEHQTTFYRGADISGTRPIVHS